MECKIERNKKSVTVVTNLARKKEFVVNVCIITEKEENFQHVILLQK